MAGTLSKNFRKQALTVFTLDTEVAPFSILVNANAVNGDTRKYNFVANARTSAGANIAVTNAVYNVTGTDAGKVTVTLASYASGTVVTLNGAIDYETKIEYT